jgi:hypothetical protein
LHLKVQLARSPGSAEMIFAHVDCVVRALHPKHRDHSAFNPVAQFDEEA